MKIYQLKCIDVSDSEHTITNWVKPFEFVDVAASYAESDYGDVIYWENTGINHKTSIGLGDIMYEIEETELGTKKDIPPEMIPDNDLDLTNLKKIVNEYIKFISSDNYHEDNDYDHYIFEAALKTFYGEDIFQSYIYHITNG